MIGDPSPTNAKPVRASVSRREILRDFDKLIQERKLSGAARDPAFLDGAEFDSKVLKKKGKGTRFLVRKVPSRAKLLRLWARLFENAISPCALVEALSPKSQQFEHREALLLFGSGWIMYDASIVEGGESVGELTLSFASRVSRALGWLAFFRGERFRIVRIEHIQLASQRSGYASALFRHYEGLFDGLGFDQFRLSASLSIGKYYWAREGFDFSDGSEIRRRKGELRALVRERNLPVTGVEIERLSHAYDIAGFRRDVKIAAYRDAEGYYSLMRDERFREEVFLPLGKAFLLAGPPWEGYKTISASGTAARAST